MQMLYDSDHFVVMRFELPAEPGGAERGGYEIVDKFARKEIFIAGALAESFTSGVRSLAERDPSPEDFDAYIERFTELAHQPLTLQ